METYYPDIFIKVTPLKHLVGEFDGEDLYKIYMRTSVRKKHTDGLWYLCDIIKTLTDKKPDTKELLHRMHFEAYMTIICGIIDVGLTDYMDQPIYRKDPLQLDEAERLRRILIY